MKWTCQFRQFLARTFRPVGQTIWPKSGPRVFWMNVLAHSERKRMFKSTVRIGVWVWFRIIANDWWKQLRDFITQSFKQSPLGSDTISGIFWPNGLCDLKKIQSLIKGPKGHLYIEVRQYMEEDEYLSEVEGAHGGVITTLPMSRVSPNTARRGPCIYSQKMSSGRQITEKRERWGTTLWKQRCWHTHIVHTLISNNAPRHRVARSSARFKKVRSQKESGQPTSYLNRVQVAEFNC